MSSMYSISISIISYFYLFGYSFGLKGQKPVQYDIAEYILRNYNADLIPRKTHNSTVNVHMSMQLYQIIEVNEPQQYLLLNAWVIERWTDHMLDWDPANFDNVSEIMIPHYKLWLPDTTLYNSLTMNHAETKRLMNAQLTTTNGSGANVKLLYPTMYKFSCNLDLRAFPFDVQQCKMILGSWTFDNTYIDYFPRKPYVGTANFLKNEEWSVLGTYGYREEIKYACCPNNYTLLHYIIHLRRKPLYYVINLIIPTGIITLISIVGFFTSSSINDIREEKITLGITTLLSMSILILMVSDKMPSTSSFIPLIGWFYTFMIMLISCATLASSFVIYIQKQGLIGNPPEKSTMKWARRVGKIFRVEMPLIMKEAYAAKAREDKLRNGYARKQSVWQKILTRASSSSKLNLNQSRQSPTGSIADSLLFDTKEKMDLNAASCPDYSALMTDSPRKKIQDPLRRPPTLKISRDESDHLVIPPLSLDSSSPTLLDLQNLSLFPTQRLVSPRSADRRNLAQLEFDWLAAVVERLLLLLFLLLFALMSVGINLIGWYYWYIAGFQYDFYLVDTTIS